ncbi:carboxymuconolactone decarboxylase family protein [Halobacillus sp. ACCC02827]|uniref:carboxymuconolactone decarboxylase family protein n=1 Tax=Bacillaceae TaxID=186817 RepID=UPI0002A4EC0E|nr:MULTISPECIES: carboxymuconolactone decarboxylase family protein [Bacillaceae]ELK46990.1 putative carboxymuconolactone decarboxylase [Halobacillus sp. BAB-2008]QHT47540.1 carboxymuconolactone decarboxylase family protein [Bacillus sp. SB49]WJE14770.1 carboxymuconolactone decarboxylase family protein [Halobacillus sp. ACCC02827]
MEENNRTWTETYLHDYKEGMGLFKEHMPEVAHQFSQFTEECFKEGEISQKQKQLIALGISIVAQDEYCMIYHTKGCVDQGASEKEVLEACGVAAAFGGGAALSQAVTLVQDAYKDLSTNVN